MKKTLLLTAICGASLFAANSAYAQEETVVVAEETIVSDVPCQTHYYSTSRDNWFIQIGAGIQSPFVENYNHGEKPHRKINAVYNFGFGKWISPYLGWRLNFLGGEMRWNQNGINKANTVSAHLDFMWDMFNSMHGVNSSRVFSIIPYVGLGGSYQWDFRPAGMIQRNNGKTRHTSWTLPVSAGLQLRFRLSKYVDLFFEGRAQFHGDNYNNYATGRPIDINISGIGGLTFNIGGSGFRTYNPCDYVAYINSLNNQVNDLRAALAGTTAALAEAEAQLPCPEVTEAAPAAQSTPLMATVRFRINSDVVTPEEEVNVYNIAQWMKANPDQNVVIAGYADKDTGTAAYNMALSKRRSETVRDILVNKYGINPDRLTLTAEGSSVQPYDVNNWNRIVIFSTK